MSNPMRGGVWRVGLSSWRGWGGGILGSALVGMARKREIPWVERLYLF